MDANVMLKHLGGKRQTELTHVNTISIAANYPTEALLGAQVVDDLIEA